VARHYYSRNADADALEGHLQIADGQQDAQRETKEFEVPYNGLDLAEASDTERRRDDEKSETLAITK